MTDTGGGYTVPATANTITIAADATTSSDRVTITAADNSVDAADLATTVTGTVANTHDGRNGRRGDGGEPDDHGRRTRRA